MEIHVFVVALDWELTNTFCTEARKVALPLKVQAEIKETLPGKLNLLLQASQR